MHARAVKDHTRLAETISYGSDNRANRYFFSKNAINGVFALAYATSCVDGNTHKPTLRKTHRNTDKMSYTTLNKTTKVYSS